MLQNFADLWMFFPHALLAGAVIAVVCAILGVFVILKRVVFIGITLAQVAAAGVAAALALGFSPFLGAAVLTLVTVTILALPFETQRLPRDAVLGAIFILAAGGSILIVARSAIGLEEVMARLYGDLILTNPSDLTVILGGNSRTVSVEVEAGRTYEIPLKFGGRWGALKIEFPEQSTET